MSSSHSDDELMAPPPAAADRRAPQAQSEAALDDDLALSPTAMAPPPPASSADKKARRAARKAKREEDRKKREAAELERKIDFSTLHASADIFSPIDWKGIKKVGTSDSGEGSNGVFFLQTSDDHLFVLKGSPFLAEEIFASELALRLPKPIRVPRMRLIEYRPAGLQGYGEEWSMSKYVLEKFARDDVSVQTKYQKNMIRAYFLLMEFVSGCSPGKVGKALTASQLKELGRVCVFDIVVNNFDRCPVPGLFDHEGNHENFMVLRDGSVCAIDTVVNPFRHVDAVEEYYAGVEKVVEAHCKSSVTDNRYVAAIAEYVRMSTGFAVPDSDEGKGAIWAGMDEMFREGLPSRQLIAKVKKEVRRQMTGKDWEAVWANSFIRIDDHFIACVVERIQKAYKRHHR